MQRVPESEVDTRQCTVRGWRTRCTAGYDGETDKRWSTGMSGHSKWSQIKRQQGVNDGEAGSVGWQFKARGPIAVKIGKHNPEEIELAAIDAGAADVQTEEDEVQVITERADLEAVRRALTDAGYEVTASDLTLIP